MYGVDGSGQAIVANHRQALGLGFGQYRVGGNRANGGVAACQQCSWRLTAQQSLAHIAQAGYIAAARLPRVAPVSGSTTSPTALHAINAPTVIPSTHTEAVPVPPFMAHCVPNSLPTLTPVPAPNASTVAQRP